LIKKKVRNDTPPDTNTTGAVRSAYVHSQLDNIQMSTSLSEALDTIEESSDESNVKFDLLSDDVDNHEVNSTSDNIYPYSAFKGPLGLVKSVSSSL